MFWPLKARHLIAAPRGQFFSRQLYTIFQLDNVSDARTGLRLWQSEADPAGLSWTAPHPVVVRGLHEENVTSGTHVAPANGIELQHGPHRGRFLLPYAQASTGRDKYAAHALTVFSDDNGANWTAGALLPDYSGEASIAELANGSVLISFRSEGEHMPRHPHNRGFARSVGILS